MDMKRIAEELENLGNQQEDKELEETLAACGLTADDDKSELFDDDDDDGVAPAPADEDAELMAMVASIDRESAEKDNFKVEGVNSTEQDEFDQVQGVTENGGGQKDFASVADAAKKLASLSRKLASVKDEIRAKGEVARYAKAVVSIEKAILKKASVIRKALSDKTPFSGDLGHDGPRPEKEYGAYDMSEGEEAFTKRDMGKTEWKQDSHDEVGFGVPKTESEIPKLASIKLAATKAVKLAVCLLGNKAPEDAVEAQGRDFFACLDSKALDRALSRFAETAPLYDKPVCEEKKEEVVAAIETTKPVEVTPQAGATKTVEQAANEVSATVEVAPAAVEVAPAMEEVPAPAVEDVPALDAPFTGDEEKEIQAMVAHVKARKAKIAAEASRRIAEFAPAVEETPAEVAPVIPEVEDATDEVLEAAKVEEAPAADVGFDNNNIELSGASDEADAVIEPELQDLFGEGNGTTASTKKATKCAQKIPSPRLASVEADELSGLWAESGEEAFK